MNLIINALQHMKTVAETVAEIIHGFHTLLNRNC